MTECCSGSKGLLSLLRYGSVLVTLALVLAVDCLDAQTIPLQVDVPPGIREGTWPVTFGVAFPRQLLRNPQQLQAFADQVEIPLQTDVLAWWNDGLEQGTDIRWLLVDLQVDAATARKTAYTLRLTDTVAPAAAGGMWRADTGTVDTGAAIFRLALDHGLELTSAVANETELLARPARFYVTDQTDTCYYAAGDIDDRLVVEDSGVQRLVLRSEGWYRAADGTPFCQHIIRLAFFAGSTRVQVLHTFVFTGTSVSHQIGDLGFELPLATGAERVATFGVDADSLERCHAVSSPELVFLEQDCVDRWHLTFSLRTPGAEPLASGTKAGGWLNLSGTAGGVTAALHEAWQNYPNELEVAADTLRVHFWPRHGRLLDFRTPALLALYGEDGPKIIDDFFLSQGEPYKRSIFDVYNNAMGVAKTHELWLDFHAGPLQTSRAVQLAHQAQTPVLGAAEPQWNCAAGALGPLQAFDPERFPEAEAALDAMFDRYVYWRDHYLDFGWFDYQDVHCSVRGDSFGRKAEAGPMPWLWRYWDSTHYGFPNAPWLQYLRTGQRKYLAFAEANSRHCLDIDRCHYGDDVDRYKGGHYYCDWSIIHWARWTETHINYDKLEYMLYYYYLRGYRRGLEVMKDWAELHLRYYLDGTGRQPFQMIRPPRLKDIRHYGPPLGNMTELYRATYDKRYLAAAHKWAQALQEMHPRTDEDWHDFGAVHFCWDGMTNYLRLTGDPIFRATVASYAEHSLRQPPRYGSAGDAASGYAATGDLSLLTAGKARLLTQLSRINTGDDVARRGAGGTWAAGHYPYAMRTIPVLLAAMTAAPPAWQARELPLVPQNRSCQLAGPRLPVLHLRALDGGPAELDLLLGQEQSLTVSNAAGDGVQTAACQFPPQVTTLTLAGRQTIRFPVKSTRHEGDYIERGNVDLIDVRNGQLAIGPSTEDGKFCVFGMRFYFLVPEGTPSFTVTVDTHDTWALYAWHPVVQLFSPGGRAVAVGQGPGVVVLTMSDLAAEQCGKLWSVGPIGRVSAPLANSGGNRPMRKIGSEFPAWIKLSENLPQYLATHPELFFVPTP